MELCINGIYVDYTTKLAWRRDCFRNAFDEEMEILSPKGGVWGITTIQGILTNEVYTGQNMFGKYEVKKSLTGSLIEK
ncbi:hypothetical protein BSK49_22950 [Paenibacillus odorifer]|nr:hypothetical protein BSK49_22950 [Paenibacillus odorifer]